MTELLRRRNSQKNEEQDQSRYAPASAIAPERLTHAPTAEPYCGDKYHDGYNEVRCTRKIGHAGDHRHGSLYGICEWEKR
jgi:hypothetical protein